MAKLPFIKFYPYDWMNDTRGMSVAAKGCWIDILCLMWNAEKRGVWAGTFEEFARATGCPWNDAKSLIDEICKVCSVTLRHDSVTLENRRMLREQREHKLASNRQSRWRCRRKSNGVITNKTLDVRCQTLEKDKETSTPSAPPKKGAPIEFWKELISHIDKSWTQKKRGAKYIWNGQSLKSLKTVASAYHAWGVMALWDIYINSSDEWAIKNGFNVAEFMRQMPRLVDGNWKESANRYMEKLMPIQKDVVEKVDQLVSGLGRKIPI